MKHYPEMYSEVLFEEGLCPVAERVQKEIMQFKTNYRDLTLAKKKANILKDVINKFKN